MQLGIVILAWLFLWTQLIPYADKGFKYTVDLINPPVVEAPAWKEPTWEEEAAANGTYCEEGDFPYDVGGDWGATCKYDI